MQTSTVFRWGTCLGVMLLLGSVQAAPAHADSAGVFARVDANADGTISMQEAFDRNKDGVVSLDEVYAYRQALRNWMAVKNDPRSGLDRAEFSAFVSRSAVSEGEAR